jgi:hypothetical protein
VLGFKNLLLSLWEHSTCIRSKLEELLMWERYCTMIPLPTSLASSAFIAFDKHPFNFFDKQLSMFVF